VRAWTAALPLSGDVWQRIATSFLRNGQIGLVNVQGVSRNPELEERIVTQVAGYGRQLGRLLEAVDALAAHRPHGLTSEQKDALDGLQHLARDVARVRRETVADQADAIVGEVRSLCADPVANAAALARIRDLVQE
jgi:hypothetical protein